jgi:DNA-binding response OmpR family regulator
LTRCSWPGPDVDVPREKEARAVSGSHRILVVEDEPNVRLVFRTALESNDYAISTAPDGETALMWLEHEHFDLVLLDLQMPGMGGMEALGRLRDQGNDLPVVIISAHDQAPNVVQAMRFGAIDFLPKPLTPEALRRVVADVLARGEEGQNTAEGVGGEKKPRSMLSSAKRALGHRLFHRAGVLLREAIKENPSSAEPCYLLGVLNEVENQPRAASKAYRDALRVDPDYEPARLHLMKYQPGK